jgi:hypothetical protein
MSLSPFDSFQSRFVTYLLNFPRNINVTPALQGMVYTIIKTDNTVAALDIPSNITQNHYNG